MKAQTETQKKLVEVRAEYERVKAQLDELNKQRKAELADSRIGAVAAAEAKRTARIDKLQKALDAVRAATASQRIAE